MLRNVLTFLIGPAGRWIVLILALSIWTTYHRLDAAHKAEVACERGRLAAEVEALRKQLAVAEEIEQNANRRAEKAMSEMVRLREDSDALARLVAETPAADCDIPSDIRDRLRAIR